MYEIKISCKEIYRKQVYTRLVPRKDDMVFLFDTWLKVKHVEQNLNLYLECIKGKSRNIPYETVVLSVGKKERDSFLEKISKSDWNKASC